VGARASAIAETAPGLILLALVALVAQSYGVRPSVLPLLAALLPFLAASIASRRALPRALRRLYSWRYYDAVSPLLLLPSLLLVLRVGYEYYDLWYVTTLLKLITSFSAGLALFLVAYPVLRRL